jgi:hypothetical protein
VSDLYEADILAWAERQAWLLRRIARGERVNDADLDWPNIAEEVEDVGRSELHAVQSTLVQALLHDLEAEAWPLSQHAPHWHAEARRLRDDAAARFTPAMRQRIDMVKLYRRALHAMPDTIDGQPPPPVAQDCPATLDELVAERP